jgi:hypothetical protein
MIFRHVFTIALALVLFTGCDAVKELTTVDFNSTLEFVLNANESTAGENIVYETTLILDAADADPEIADYADNIEDITVNSLEFSIDNYSGPQDGVYLSNGVFGFADEGAADFSPQSSCTVDNLLIINSDAYFDIFTCNLILDKIAEQLIRDQAVKLFLEGTLQAAPVSFDLHIRMQVKVTATAF